MAEYLVATAITAIIVLAVCSLSLFNGRSFAAYASYVDLDLANRNTLNQLVKDLRMARGLTSYAPNRIILLDLKSNAFDYTYNSSARTLSRTKDGTTKILLKDCSRLTFFMNERTLSNGTFNLYRCTNFAECKAITVNWCASRTYLGIKSDDMPQTATIVMRN